MSRTPRLPARLAVEATKLAVVGTIAFVAVAPAFSEAPQPTAEQRESRVSAVETGARSEVERLMDRHDCSTSGFGPDVIPGSALVERGSRVEHVTFDDGWAVYTGERSGSLIAVCRVTV